MFKRKEKKQKQTKAEKNFAVREQQMKVQEDAWEREKDLLERQYKIEEEKENIKPKKKSMTTTKWIVAFLFLNCTAVEIFTAWATWKSLYISEIIGTYADFSPLTALIGAVVTEVIGFAVYAAKSAKENSEGGITYLNAQSELQNLAEPEEGSEAEEGTEG